MVSSVVTFRSNDFIKLHNTEEFATCLDKTVFLIKRSVSNLTTIVVFPVYLTVNFWCWLLFGLLCQGGLMCMNLFMKVRTLSVQRALKACPFPAPPSPLVSILVPAISVYVAALFSKYSFDCLWYVHCFEVRASEQEVSRMSVSCGKVLAKNCWNCH